MGGVDLADQMAGLFDLDRKSLEMVEKGLLPISSLCSSQLVGSSQRIAA